MMYAKYKTYNGVEVPAIGFGTGVVRKYSRNPYFFLKNIIMQMLRSVYHRKCSKQLYGDIHMKKIVENAYAKGFRLFDSGRIYGYSEKMIGDAVSKYDREELFIVTKISDMDIDRKASPDNVEGNFANSLKFLNTDYVDAYLLHWPHGDWISIYKGIEKQYKMGKANTIGVCNFNIEQLEILKKECTIKPMLLQTELHPLNSKKELRNYCNKEGIVMMAHTPTGRMCEKIRESEVLKEIAGKYNKSIAQIILRWHYQNGVIPVVATASKEHMEENLKIFDFDLANEDMEKIEGINEDYIMLPGNGIDDPKYIYNL